MTAAAERTVHQDTAYDIPDNGQCYQLPSASVQPTDTVCQQAHDDIPGYSASAAHFRSYV